MTYTSTACRRAASFNQRIELMTLLRKVHQFDHQSYTAHPER
ncbi:hypothetical protein [Lentisphaera araneosa]|nr:hypothetical protein [Lentisphaera araneosa]